MNNTNTIPASNTQPVRPLDLTDQIIAYEDGELDNHGILNLFSGLIATGLAWQLQGCYGRTAADLIAAGFITNTGQITTQAQDLANE